MHKDAEDIRERRSIGTLHVDDGKDIRDSIHDIVDEGNTTDDTREWDVERDEKDDESCEEQPKRDVEDDGKGADDGGDMPLSQAVESIEAYEGAIAGSTGRY